jgi:hypothetical protein
MITIDCRKSPDYHRGYIHVRNGYFYLTNYTQVDEDDMAYLLNSILKPYRIPIVFSTELMEALL